MHSGGAAMTHEPLRFRFLATGIGSVPFRRVEQCCLDIVSDPSFIPFWPQLVKQSELEDMSIQFSEGLPLLEPSPEGRALVVSDVVDRERHLVAFYERVFAHDVDYFAISRRYAKGLYTMLDLLAGVHPPAGAFVKGQTVGPVTFAAGITDLDGNAALHNPELVDAMSRGLALKALWQVRMLAASGRRPIIFLDEPYLSGFGSAFSPIQRDEVVDLLGIVVGYLKEHSQALVGIHCCGNTDWSMIMEAGFDIISFDAFEYMEHFLLYPDHLVSYLGSGGAIAWGIVPTVALREHHTAGGLADALEEGFEKVCSWGVDPDMLADRSILTPACGTGTMHPETARRTLKLLSEVSGVCRSRLT